MATILRTDQLYTYATQAGFTGTARDTAVAIAMAESGGNPSAQNCSNANNTCDRGLLQINNYWHPEVSDQCAYNPLCAFQSAYTISNGGTDFTPWTTYNNGAYQKFLSTGAPTYPTSSSTSSIQDAIQNLMGPSFVFVIAIVAIIIGLVVMTRGNHHHGNPTP